MSTTSNTGSNTQPNGTQPAQQQITPKVIDPKPPFPPLESVRHYTIIPDKKPKGGDSGFEPES